MYVILFVLIAHEGRGALVLRRGADHPAECPSIPRKRKRARAEDERDRERDEERDS